LIYIIFVDILVYLVLYLSKVKPKEYTLQSYFGNLWLSIRRNKEWYVFVLPAVAFYLIFRYSPLYFLQIAFKDFRLTRPLNMTPWVGFKYFEQLFTAFEFWSAFKNTIIISLLKLTFAFPVPILLALLLNEVKNPMAKRIYQTILYLPHFISWVIVGSIIYSFTAVPDGLFNKFIILFGQKPIVFLGQKSMFQPILVISEIWKDSGWGTILYLAAITRISVDLYEAARIDGASRLQQIFYITLPGIKDVIAVLLILQVGNILNVGFEQVLVLQNDMVLSVGDTLDTLVYRTGLLRARYSYATAAGLFKGIVALIMILSANTISKKIGEEGLI
jgi:putative aldouronate transport system permease protein